MTANGYRVAFRGDKNALELYSGDGCTTLKTTVLYMLKWYILRHMDDNLIWKLYEVLLLTKTCVIHWRNKDHLPDNKNLTTW